MNKRKKKLIITCGLLGLMMLGGVQHGSMTAYAATPNAATQQAKQLSTRWHEVNGTWFLRNQQGTGNVVNSWFQDAGDWYLLAQGDGHMYSGLVHDTITDKWYMLNTEHDGTYGRMFCVDGVYTVNGQSIYLTFNQQHDGTFGAITSGLDALRGTGVYSEDVAGIATESESNTGSQQAGGTVVDSNIGSGQTGGTDKPYEYGQTERERMMLEMMEGYEYSYDGGGKNDWAH